MFAVPLISLVVLWGFAASITVRSAISNHHYDSISSRIDGTIQALADALPAERAESYIWLMTNRTTSEASVLSARATLNKELPASRAVLESQLNVITGVGKTALAALLADLQQLPQIRSAVDAGAVTPAAAFQDYTNIIDAQFSYFYATIQQNTATEADVSIGAVDADYSVEMLGREITLVGGALADRGQMSASVRQLFVASVFGRKQMLSQATSLLTPSQRAGYITLDASPVYQQLQALENQILGSSANGPLPATVIAWPKVSASYLTGLQAVQTRDAYAQLAQSASLSDTLVTEAILAGGVGLVAVLGSIVLLVWFGRKVTGDMSRLDHSVREMADVRLPQVVERLRQGDDIDVPVESPPPVTSGIREVARIAESFSSVQEAAVAAAVDQARLRIGINQVFRNISMRSQSLLHRQLAMLDTMERGTGDPATLSDLFRLDHLTTRMRRHAEGLIILSGASPGRGWRAPVPVVDVLRAAVAEVEDYVRVDVVSESRDLIVGNAVSDIIHLVAELVENATVFSPPNTRIEVRADRVGAGLAVEIEDRGLGLTGAERDDINGRLSITPEFDLGNSQQLGLFVVSRLAARHSIKVSLCESVYGGTTAILLLPFGVAVRAEEAEPPGALNMWFDDNGSGGELDGISGSRRGRLARGHRLFTAAAVTDGEPDWMLPPATSPLEPAESWQSTLSLPPGSSRTSAPPWEPNAWETRAWETNGREPNAATPWPSREDAVQSDPAGGSHLGMPVRVPQASLASQLRPGRPGEPDAAHDASTRSPEANRDLMNLMQQGWARGRVDDLDDDSEARNDTD